MSHSKHFRAPRIRWKLKKPSLGPGPTVLTALLTKPKCEPESRDTEMNEHLPGVRAPVLPLIPSMSGKGLGVQTDRSNRHHVRVGTGTIRITGVNDLAETRRQAETLDAKKDWVIVPCSGLAQGFGTLTPLLEYEGVPSHIWLVSKEWRWM
ncbi:hypothetical protein FA13DRAFT_1711692 [Coprinellus micaceus]|uniref:Uncharacterized protein n=1 Tax=Coprinellus micaceus TaxID=71717 RepID=A0A4Y7T401_COPMI|nr:hypothetical protein FA13DRAFT_1711692 [Coprinellus micaceus]